MPERDKCIAPKHWYACVSGVRTDLMPYILDLVANGPEATPDVQTTPFNTPVTIPALGNDLPGDFPIDPAQTVLSGDPPPATQGTVSIDPATGDITFTPAVGFSGVVDQFSYCIFDTDGNKAITTVDITVEPNIVVAVDDGPFDLPQGGTITFNKTANDSDPEGDTFTVTEIAGQPVANAPFTIGGLTITDNGDGTCDATAPSDQPVAPVVFEYTIEDSNGNTDDAEVTINVTEVPSGNFVLSGGDGSDISGTLVKDAIANGDAIVPASPAGEADSCYTPGTTVADLQAIVDAKIASNNGTGVFDPATCTWTDPEGVCPTIPLIIKCLQDTETLQTWGTTGGQSLGSQNGSETTTNVTTTWQATNNSATTAGASANTDFDYVLGKALGNSTTAELEYTMDVPVCNFRVKIDDIDNAVVSDLVTVTASLGGAPVGNITTDVIVGTVEEGGTGSALELENPVSAGGQPDDNYAIICVPGPVDSVKLTLQDALNGHGLQHGVGIEAASYSVECL